MGIVSFSLLLLYNRYSFRENSIVLFCHFENEIHHSSIFGRRNAHDAVYLCCSIVRGTTRGRRKRNAKIRNRNAKRNRFDKRRQTNAKGRGFHFRTRIRMRPRGSLTRRRNASSPWIMQMSRQYVTKQTVTK